MQIKFRVDVYLHQSDDTAELQELIEHLRTRNDELASAVQSLSQQPGAFARATPRTRKASQENFAMSTDASTLMEQLRAEVERNQSVDQSAITLITTLAARLEEVKNDPSAVQALIDEMRSSSDELAEAVTANTSAQEQSSGNP